MKSSISYNNWPLTHSLIDSKIKRFYIYFFIGIISLTTVKIVTVPCKSSLKMSKIVEFAYNFLTFEPCKKSEDSFIAKRKFTSCYNIKIV
jgi:hypothetical protein